MAAPTSPLVRDVRAGVLHDDAVEREAPTHSPVTVRNRRNCSAVYSRAWWNHDAAIVEALDRVRAALRTMWEQTVGSGSLPSISSRLAALRERLLERADLMAVLDAWQRSHDAVEQMRARIGDVPREAR